MNDHLSSRPPLILLVGFLGAGKTTFLERVIPELESRGRTPHIILNDYKNAGIDSARLAKLTKLVQPIHGSCVCCESRDELLDSLSSLSLSDDGVVLVEANGTTDAEELVELLAMDSRARKFARPVQVAVIDASRWQKRLWHNALEAAQVKMAGYGWLTRLEEVSEKRRDKVVDSLMGMNSRLVISDPSGIVDKVIAQSGEASPEPQHDGGTCCSGDCECEHDHAHSPHSHSDHHFASAERTLPEVVDREMLTVVLDDLPREAVRVKGICYFEKGGAAHLFQRVDGDRNPTIVPLEVKPTTDPVIVLIGSHLPMDEVDQCLSRLEL